MTLFTSLPLVLYIALNILPQSMGGCMIPTWYYADCSNKNLTSVDQVIGCTDSVITL